MKTMIREMVETIKQLFVQKQLQKPVAAESAIPEKAEQAVTENKPEKSPKPNNKWNKSLTLQLKEYLDNNFVFRYNSLTGATEYRGISEKNVFAPLMNAK